MRLRSCFLGHERIWFVILLVSGAGSCVLADEDAAYELAQNAQEVFEPEFNMVPLSSFERAGGIETEVSFKIHSSILDHVSSLHLFSDAGEYIRTINCTNLNCQPKPNSIFILDQMVPGVGSYVLVSQHIRNEFPIVTHWQFTQSVDGEQIPINGGRGGRVEGGTDRIGTIVLDVTTGEFGRINDQEDATDNSNGDNGDATDLFYDTNRYALFSDGRELLDAGSLDVEPGVEPYFAANQIVPAHERYAGENYSVAGPSNLAAVWFSDRCQALTGFPARHVNHLSSAIDGLPVFQIVHAQVVEVDDPDIPGSEDSLISYILPPGWTRAESNYPVIANGFYGLHPNMFNEAVGLDMIDAIGKVYNEDQTHKAVGIVWNGGGSFPAQTSQSTVDNSANAIFGMANEEIGASLDKIFVTGGSRGGTTALMMASNPDAIYTVGYVRASGAQVEFGTTHKDFFQPCYPLVQDALRKATGYVDGWRPDWINPTPELYGVAGDTTLSELLQTLPISEHRKITSLHVLTGTTSYQEADSNAPLSDTRLFKLAESGTQVLFNISSHDFVNSFSSHLKYARALQQFEIPNHVAFRYRRGHTGEHPYVQYQDSDLLRSLFPESDPLNLNGISIYVRNANDFNAMDLVYDSEVDSPTDLEHWPAIVELPKIASRNEEIVFTVAGPKGMDWVIKILDENNTWQTWEAGVLPGQSVGEPLSLRNLEYQLVTNSMDQIGPGLIQYKFGFRFDSSHDYTYLEDPNDMGLYTAMLMNPAASAFANAILPQQNIWVSLVPVEPLVNTFKGKTGGVSSN